MIRKVTFSSLLLVMVAAAFVAGSWRAQRDAVSAASLHGRRILYYVDPMHPSYRSDKPGIAPDCNMPLEPIYADGGPAVELTAGAVPSTAIAVDDAKQQAIGVRVSTVQRVAGVERLRLFGRVAAAETRIYKLHAGLDGYIREISGVTTGSQVRKDEWLATFSAPEIRQPIQGYVATLDSLDREAKNGATASVQMAFARAGAEQSVDRLLTLGMSPVQVEEIRRTRVVPPNIRLTAPADGFVVARNVSAGEKIEKGAELYRIADLRRVWVLADVAAADAALARPGTIADVKVAGGAPVIRARLTGDVLPQFDPATQYFKLRFEVDNAGYALRPEMVVDVELQVPFGDALTIPADAIVASGHRNTVFVERSAGVFEPREIEVGRHAGDRVLVVSGLSSGERIVVSGTFLLDSESRMRAHDQPHH